MSGAGVLVHPASAALLTCASNISKKVKVQRLTEVLREGQDISPETRHSGCARTEPGTRRNSGWAGDYGEDICHRE